MMKNKEEKSDFFSGKARPQTAIKNSYLLLKSKDFFIGERMLRSGLFLGSIVTH
ncbi:MAG: hypothetical protein ACFNWZ_04310 [Candidatus Absconditicoccaceae bacterium]